MKTIFKVAVAMLFGGVIIFGAMQRLALRVEAEQRSKAAEALADQCTELTRECVRAQGIAMEAQRIAAAWRERALTCERRGSELQD